MSLWLTVEVSAGTDIKSACVDAVEVAKKLNVSVWFVFNGVKCLADARTDPQRLEHAWNDALLSNHTHKVASDRERT